MKLKRRIVILLLAAVVMIGMLPAAAEEAAAETAQQPGEKQQVLQLLQVLPEEISPQSTVSRGMFAQAIAGMLGEDPASKTTDAFVDVDSRTQQMGAIAVVTQQGYMGGYTDGSFRPDDKILLVDAAKVLLAVLGYQTEAELNGGYPMGYLVTGSGIRLLSGVQGGVQDELTGGQLIQMLYNTFDIDLRVQKEYGGHASYASEKGKTFWSERRSIYRAKGIVSANEYTHLASGNGTGEGYVKIDNLLCQKGTSGIENYLGYQVQAYIHQELREDEGTVLAFEYQRYNDVVQIFSDDILEGTTLRSVEYTKDGKKQRMTVQTAADLLYNGKALRDAVDADMRPENGILTLIDRGADGVADAVWIDDYLDYAVLNVNRQNESISDQYDQPLLKLEDTEYILTRDGFPEDLLFVKEWDILSAAVSRDGKFAKLAVTSKNITGTVEAMGDETIVVGGTEYDIAVSQAEPMKVGDQGTFYLDIFGKVAAFRKDVSEEVYGYLIKAGLSGAIEQKLQFQMYDMDQSKAELILDAADNLTIDGISMTGEAAIKALEKSAQVSERGSGVAQLIRYRKNSKDEVSAIDTVIREAGENENSMELSMGSTGTELVFKGLLFSGKAACGPSTKVLVVPADMNKIKDYKVVGKSYFNYDGRYRIEAYCMDESFVPEVLIVYPADAGGTGKIDIYYGTLTVEKVTKSINSDDESIKLVKGVMEGKNVEYELDPDAPGADLQLKLGDVLAVERTDSRITAVQKLFDIDNPLPYGMDGAYTGKNVITYGKAMSKNGSVMGVAIKEDLSETVGFEITRVTVVNTVNKTVRIGSSDDVVAFKETKDAESSSSVLVYSYYGTTKDVVVFETE